MNSNFEARLRLAKEVGRLGSAIEWALECLKNGQTDEARELLQNAADKYEAERKRINQQNEMESAK